MSELITSAGKVGTDMNRSEGRAYTTLGKVVNSADTLDRSMSSLKVEASYSGRRRWVVRAVVADEEVRIDLGSAFGRDTIINDHAIDRGTTIEVDIPLRYIDPQSRRRLIIMAGNIHRTKILEYSQVFDYWRNPPPREVNPIQSVTALSDQFQLTNDADLRDASDLSEIWHPFGWTREGAVEFIKTYRERNDLWFSAIRDRSSGRLVSACQGESIEFADLLLVEGTEYSTLPGFEGQGLCTAAVTGLHAQILGDTLYRNGRMPMIYSELNMSTRADMIARKTGMTVPLVEDAVGRRSVDRANQVLVRNVSVLDNQPPNDLTLEELGDEQRQAKYRAAYGENFKFWRNFIAAILPKIAIDRYYSANQCREIINHYE